MEELKGCDVSTVGRTVGTVAVRVRPLISWQVVLQWWTSPAAQLRARWNEQGTGSARY